MALQHQTLAQRVTAVPSTLRVLLFLVLVVGAMLLATWIFGVRLAGPSYDLVPDPGAGLGLPF